MSDWIRAMGIDYGTARIGLAVSDDIGLLAHPLETVPAADLDRAARADIFDFAMPVRREGERLVIR